LWVGTTGEMSPPPFIAIPNSLVHILTNATVLDQPEPLHVLSVMADGNSLSFEMDRPSKLLLTAYMPPVRLSEERRIEGDMTSRGGQLVGKTVKTVRGNGTMVLAAWEARRAVEPWEDAPVVTFLLVGDENATHVLERADIFTP
jgi:hypothetical protein